MIDNLCGGRLVAMRSAEMRALADAVECIAADAEAHRGTQKNVPPSVRQDYPLQA